MNWIDIYLTFLLEQLQMDSEVYRNVHMWWPLLIPAIFYGIFCCVKYVLLCAPFIIPLKLVLYIIKRMYDTMQMKWRGHYTVYDLKTREVYGYAATFAEAIDMQAIIRESNPNASTSIKTGDKIKKL